MKTIPLVQASFRVLLAMSALLLNPEAQADPATDDCPACATVVELDQAAYLKPFQKWDIFVSNLGAFADNFNELKSVSYNSERSFTYHFNNTVRLNSVTGEFNAARLAALNSGLVVKSHEFNGPQNWFVLWGTNNFTISGYPALETELIQIQAQGKAITQIVIKPGTQSYLILLEDGTTVSQGIPQATLDLLGNVLLIKRVSLSHDGNLAVVKTDGTLVVTGDNLSANQQAFIAMITADIAQQGFQADYLYFGPNKEMIFYARKAGAASYLRFMGPIREQTNVSTVGGNLELIQHLSPGYKYQLYRSPDLVIWQKIGPDVTGDNTFKKFTTPIGADRGIYRFKVTFAAP